MKGLFDDGLFDNSNVIKFPAIDTVSISYPFELCIEIISRGLVIEVEFLMISVETTDPPTTLQLTSIPLTSFFTINFGEVLYRIPPVIIPI